MESLPQSFDPHAAVLAGLVEGFARKGDPLSLADVAEFAERAGAKFQAVLLADVVVAGRVAHSFEELERHYGRTGRPLPDAYDPTREPLASASQRRRERRG